MSVNIQAYQTIKEELASANVTLVAVSKIKSVQEIKELYDAGQRDFGENYVQELVAKFPALPADIRWHYIGHLQSNKVKYIAPFVSMIQGVDTLKLLQEINRQAAKNERVIDCLLQVHLAKEETKFGLDEKELGEAIAAGENLKNVRICGLMGMASFSDDLELVRSEFRKLKALSDKNIEHLQGPATILSMGMSGDYKLAIQEGSTMVRIGSLLFGQRLKT